MAAEYAIEGYSKKKKKDGRKKWLLTPITEVIIKVESKLTAMLLRVKLERLAYMRRSFS